MRIFDVIGKAPQMESLRGGGNRRHRRIPGPAPIPEFPEITEAQTLLAALTS
jgi:hypothetical protein